MLKPGVNLQKLTAEPDQINLTAAVQITDIIPMHSRAVMDALDAHHIWTPALIDMRFNYRPENPLYLLLVRAYKLPTPITIQNTPAYAGCKSWVPLEKAVNVGAAIPALIDSEYEKMRNVVSEMTNDK